MFNPNWVQLWLDMPKQGLPHENPARSSLHWFTADVSPYPGAYDYFTAGVHLLDWVMAGPFGLTAAFASGIYLRQAWVYYNTSSGLVSIGASRFETLPVTDPLSYSVQVVVQRRSASLSRRQLGRYFVSPIDASMVDGNHLTIPALAAFQAAADSQPLSVVFGGQTFRPIITSYSLGAAIPITGFLVDQRLGQVKRRNRPRQRPSMGPGSGPKPPPP